MENLVHDVCHLLFLPGRNAFGDLETVRHHNPETGKVRTAGPQNLSQPKEEQGFTTRGVPRCKLCAVDSQNF